MIEKLKNGFNRLFSRRLNPKTGKRRNLGTKTHGVTTKHERESKRH